MKKIIIYNDHWCSGGVESFWTNIINSIGITEDFHFRILVAQKESDIYDSILEKNNVKVEYIIDKPTGNPFKRIYTTNKKIKKKLSELECDILHINTCNAFGLKISKVAKKIGIENVIVHAHNSQVENDRFRLKRIYHFIAKRFYSKYPDYYFACSRLAGEFVFSKKYYNRIKIINNGVNIDRFSFNADVRVKTRDELNINNEIVIGHIGRFSEQKNQSYVIKIFNEFNKINKNSKLLLIGDGTLKNKIDAKIEKLGLKDKVIEIINTKDIEKYYQAMDVFILPSKHEGLPVVGVEAQTSGLPVIFSDSITREVKISDNVLFVSIKNKPIIWAISILENSKKIINRSINKEITKNKGFDIIDVANELKDFYLK